MNRFKLSNNSHLRLLLIWPLFFASYFLTEALVPTEVCRPIHCALDEQIPFCESFVIPYVLWYPLIAGSLIYFARYHKESFVKLMRFIIVITICATAIFILFPSKQELRPSAFPRDNLLSRIVGQLYAADTNTNVFPSVHVAFSVGIAFVWVQTKEIHAIIKVSVVCLAILICLSTVFIKQHSVLDGLAAIPLCVVAGIICSLRLNFSK